MPSFRLLQPPTEKEKLLLLSTFDQAEKKKPHNQYVRRKDHMELCFFHIKKAPPQTANSSREKFRATQALRALWCYTDWKRSQREKVTCASVMMCHPDDRWGPKRNGGGGEAADSNENSRRSSSLLTRDLRNRRGQEAHRTSAHRMIKAVAQLWQHQSTEANIG